VIENSSQNPRFLPKSIQLLTITMESVPDFSDKKAWDDSYLVNSWDEALDEYNVGQQDSYLYAN
jgi:hypothetical protein